MGTPNSRQFSSSTSICLRESGSDTIGSAVAPSVGTLWSAVASVRSGRRSLASGEPQRLEGLRRGDLVDQVEVHVEEALGHLVGVPDLVEQRLGHLSSS